MTWVYFNWLFLHSGLNVVGGPGGERDVDRILERARRETEVGRLMDSISAC